MKDQSMITKATFTTLVSLIASTQMVQAQTIDFETLPSGAATTDNMLINAQYEAEFGIRFSLVNQNGEKIGFPRIAKVGSPLTAFVSCQGDDTPDSGLGVGDSFLTDDGVLGNSADLLIEYISPVSEASGVILDVDARSSDPGAIESWIVEAYSPSGELLSTAIINAPQGPDEPGCEGFNGEGDGSARGFSFLRANPDIASIQFSYTGNAKLGSVGLAFDNFSPSTAVEELQVELLFLGGVVGPLCQGDEIFLGFSTSGGFSDQEVRWERRVNPDDPWEETALGDVDGGYFPVNGEEIRVVVDDGSIEVASDSISFEVKERSFSINDTLSDIIIDDAALFLFDAINPDELWGDDPTSFDNDEIETVSEGVHVVPALTANGAHLAVIYNTTGGSTPGTVTTEIISLNWEPELIFVDDPDDPMYNDTYTVEDLGPGMKRFTLVQTWAGDKTDGFIIGPMTDGGSCSITFTESSGLSTGLCFNGDGAPIPFNFTDGMELTFESSCNSTCVSDLTGEGDLNFLDVSAFLTAFATQDPIADFEADGNYNFLDVSAFLSEFSSGCQ
jgi:hypothetical protein